MATTTGPYRPARTTTARDARLRARRAAGVSTRRLAMLFGISQVRVRQILNETGGDPLALSTIEAMTDAELEREAARLDAELATFRRERRVLADELEARRVDRLLGLTG